MITRVLKYLKYVLKMVWWSTHNLVLKHMSAIDVQLAFYCQFTNPKKEPKSNTLALLVE